MEEKGQRPVSQDSHPEGLKKRIRRHLLNRDWDLGTVVRGVLAVADYARALGNEGASVSRYEVENDFGGIKGLVLTRFQLDYKHAVVGMRIRDARVSIVDFPPGSRLVVEFLQKPMNVTQYLHHNRSQRMAVMVGPTAEVVPGVGLVPNNGFFVKDRGGLIKEFAETEPKGERRGAIWIKRREM